MAQRQGSMFNGNPIDLLYFAVLHQDMKHLQQLLDKTPPLNLETRHPMVGSTVLFAAQEEYYNEATGSGDYVGTPQRSGGKAYKILELLLQRGASPNTSFVNPQTGSILFPYSTLAQYGLIEGLRLFLASPTLDVMAPSRIKRGQLCWPICLALAQHHTDAALLLIRHASFDVRVDSRVLATAAEADDVRVVKELLALPGINSVINVTHTDPHKASTPLTQACYSGHSCAIMLLAAGASPLIDRCGLLPTADNSEPDLPSLNATPMACAITSGADPGLIDELVKAGARRPTIVTRGKDHYFVGRDGHESFIFDMRTMQRDGNKRIFNMSSARSSETTGLFDARFDKFSCENCGKSPAYGEQLLRCGRCKRASYCGIDCQRAHWKVAHKAACVEV